jgi:hypothetical protein
VPLSWPANLLHGLLAGGVAVTSAALVLLWVAFRRLRVEWPLAWVLVLACASGDVLFRLTMLRPQPLSLALAVLALSFLASPGAPHRRAAIVGVAFTAAWIHLALAWLIPLVAAVYGLIAFARTRRADGTALAAVAFGSVLGAALRPHPLGALRLAWIQVGLFLEVKRRGLPLPFGLELQPLSLALDGPRLVLPALALVALALLFFALRLRRGPPVDAAARAAAWTSLVLSLLFLVLSLRVASRSLELAVAFGATFAGLAFSELWRSGSERQRTALAVALAISLLEFVPAAVHRYHVRAVGARPLLAYRGASLWLAAHARPGDLVFHVWWDQFPHLFFWNPLSHYVNGMDPLFQFARDEASFWKVQQLARDVAPEVTCGSPACDPSGIEDTLQVLRHDFGASFVLVHRAINPRLDAYLASTAGFLRVFDDGTDVVYRVLEEGHPP